MLSCAPSSPAETADDLHTYSSYTIQHSVVLTKCAIPIRSALTVVSSVLKMLAV